MDMFKNDFSRQNLTVIWRFYFVLFARVFVTHGGFRVWSSQYTAEIDFLRLHTAVGAQTCYVSK